LIRIHDDRRIKNRPAREILPHLSPCFVGVLGAYIEIEMRHEATPAPSGLTGLVAAEPLGVLQDLSLLISDSVRSASTISCSRDMEVFRCKFAWAGVPTRQA